MISWPVAGEGGLDGRLRISHGLDFLSTVYNDCIEQSKVSLDEFWELMSGMEIYPNLIIKELSGSQKDFFFLALSVLFAFDFYLIPKTKYLMSKAAKPLRMLLLRQLEDKSLISTSTNNRFLREFCTDGLVLGSQGEILFSGGLSESLEWADRNLEQSKTSESDENLFEVDLKLTNLDASSDVNDDF